MNNIMATRMGKTLLSIGICATLALSGSIVSDAAVTKVEAASSTSVANKVIQTGKKYMGTPYVFGAKSGRTSAFDCSSFTQYIFKKHGIKLPRSSREQSRVGTKVSKSQLKAGDLIFSDTNRDGIINHVSVYMGNNKVIHTYKRGVGVTISKFKGSAWDKTFKTARRVIK
ncbi:C40 family peptidase [Paenibacillus alvei]|uniref:Cell wall-associated hydrolase (Invasion-associated protein) n=1 Tax=Paenibacillus alvei TaxID=44250 RepID=A0A383RAQ6_PAEAL|nr:C40 family peptidase [Paenibacillus alvei]SYX83584.1 Cell wall-associated hydrolase (Invasion-associated protein) [Paenibacillus alvei]